MNNIESVISIIDDMIKNFEKDILSEDYDALDVSYFKCSIGTLKLLKSKLRILQDV